MTVLAPGHGECSLDRVVAQPLADLSAKDAIVFRLFPPRTRSRFMPVEQPSGKPIPGARVGLIYDDPSIDNNFAWGYHDTAWGDSVHARTDASGIVTFSPLTFIDATVLVQAEGYARKHVGWRNGAANLSVKLPREAVIEGKLLDQTTGKPLDGLIIQVFSPTAGQIGTMTHHGDAGKFRLGELPAGNVTLSIATQSGANLHSEQLKLTPGSRIDRTLRLSPAGR